jgi:hypothetical protein
MKEKPATKARKGGSQPGADTQVRPYGKDIGQQKNHSKKSVYGSHS